MTDIESDFGTRINLSIDRNGSLSFVSKIYLKVSLPEIKIFTRKYVNFVIIENKKEENIFCKENDDIFETFKIYTNIFKLNRYD